MTARLRFLLLLLALSATTLMAAPSSQVVVMQWFWKNPDGGGAGSTLFLPGHEFALWQVTNTGVNTTNAGPLLVYPDEGTHFYQLQPSDSKVFAAYSVALGAAGGGDNRPVYASIRATMAVPPAPSPTPPPLPSPVPYK